MTKIKICGLTTPQDVLTTNKIKADFAGFVLFYPKSKRNLTIMQAENLLSSLDSSVKSVAVTVSPSPEEALQIQKAGFDYIQIHGTLFDETLEAVSIPVLRAFNVSDLDNYEHYKNCDQIAGYVFDALTPGSGASFDWSLVQALPRDGKLWLLAGGLNPDNVADAILAVQPDGVDVSSGVETAGVVGKDADKILAFVKAVREI